MPAPDMRKEFRNELRLLKKNRRGVNSDLKKEYAINRKIIRVAMQRIKRAEKACDRVHTRIDKRIAILEGRLSS